LALKLIQNFYLITRQAINNFKIFTSNVAIKGRLIVNKENNEIWIHPDEYYLVLFGFAKVTETSVDEEINNAKNKISTFINTF